MLMDIIVMCVVNILMKWIKNTKLFKHLNLNDKYVLLTKWVITIVVALILAYVIYSVVM